MRYIECGYCSEFKKGDSKKDGKLTLRYCRSVKKYIPFNHKKCKHFELYKYMYCDNENNMIGVVVCINRQNKNRCSSTCQQGCKIKYLYETYGDANV